MFTKNINLAILIAVRLILVCNTTYLFSLNYSYIKLSETITVIFTPLKILKINPKDIGLIITIAIAFFPILKKELEEIKQGLNIKASKSLKLIFKVFLTSVFKRVDELAITLKSKAYEE